MFSDAVYHSKAIESSRFENFEPVPQNFYDAEKGKAAWGHRL